MDILLILLNIILFLGLAPLYEGIIRKLTAKIQSRQGPPIYQPYLDIMKLLGKDNLVSGNWAFKLAPMMAFAAVTAVITIVPIGFKPNYLTHYADIITIVYLLTLAGISILLGALSSKNAYAMIGASREMVTMIMVEPILAMTFILGAVKMKSLAIDASMFSVLSNGYSWSVVLMLVVYVMALQAFVARQPFDISEAEVEILEGPFIEYSGPNYALFKYSMMLKQMFYAVLFVTVFMPFLFTGIFIIDVLLQLIAVAVVFAVIALLGSTNPRLRIDQAVKYYAVLIGISLCTIAMSVYGI
ncbi:MAG TPA: NADH-quinone oxidoreductase subunit H [Spirochaetota bacterium]|nr:NADH-quinone oxidoreductase subunit H [Spirochaetota bacterium]HOR92757.1 NADH-quinone oxidoreductase subunit H [Spirochaetota bacterium]HOT18771.1 NADH-quinone oxidoreductase subunit H [Spirochaetota bacterium]HPD04264.1 NADH-quinone oxidoreductase subunit H [Spirochaetota bacterium]HQG41465.1 NADH-quinone oxidoreductase subunit H [Spirochaetota bacterium]